MKVKEIGNLTTEPTYGEKGDIKYCNFNLAINNSFNRDKPEFVRVSVYGKQAEDCSQYLQLGSQVCVEGNIKANAFIDKDGNAQASLNISATQVQFLNRIKGKDKGTSNIDKAMENHGAKSYQSKTNQGNQYSR